MPTNHLYHTWFQRIQQLFPNLRKSQKLVLQLMVTGVFLSRSIHLSQIAGKIPGSAKRNSKERRLSRFLSNFAIRVRPLYDPIARGLLEQAARCGEVRLVIDSSKVGFNHQLLMVGLAFRRRTFPICWTWVPSKKGHSSARKQLALVDHVRQLVPVGVKVLLVGDTEFESGYLQQQLDDWGWKYVLRQKPNNRVKLPGHPCWQSFGDLVNQPGQKRWVAGALLTGKHALQVNLLAYWQKGEKGPWLLATNLPTAVDTLRAYRRRMWIEEMFGDMKGHGFDLESTHLCHSLRLSRLTFVVALLYVWLLSTGARTIKNGLRHLVDRKDRRDLSLFQIGWRFIERLFVNGEKIPVHLCPVGKTVR